MTSASVVDPAPTNTNCTQMSEITETSQMEDYLQGQGIAFTTLVSLNGGGSNYAWRLVDDTSTSSSVIKHATGHLKILPHVTLPIERQYYEAQALQTLPGLLAHTGTSVHLPRLLHHDPNAHVIQIADVGPCNLSEAFRDPNLDLQSIGVRIGSWLASLHAIPTSATPTLNNDSVELATQHCMMHLPRALKRYGHENTALAVLKLLYSRPERKTSQCHGDFLPSNIVVDLKSENSEPLLSVIDWEWVRHGNALYDIGLFAGEVWLLERFRRQEGLLRGFLGGYMERRTLGEEDALLTAARMAAHVAYWATTDRWGGKDDCDAVVEWAVEVLRRSLDRDVWWLKNCETFKLLFQNPSPV
ncbi:hypothetical protein IQ07DRAFT_677091 [Pyrenochaeta sp. DS3sAY3a]|nr:hypothetical protein IQ07DRAFT_677091 [Pyrenochaeta sp. DS3sAY3a]